jgi:hypothetical protein
VTATSRDDEELLAILDDSCTWTVHDAAGAIEIAGSLRGALRLAVTQSTGGTLAQSITRSSNGEIVIPRPQLLRLTLYELVRGSLGPPSS